MARRMRNFARWHIWLGWLAGVPLLLWVVSGLTMVAKPIEEVRGNHLRIEQTRQAFSGNPRPIAFQPDGSAQAVEMRSLMQNGRFVTLVTRPDGSVDRYDATTGRPMGDITETEARALVVREIVGGDAIAGTRRFAAEDAPFDFRRPVAVWQVTLRDGTHVYVGEDSGAIEAVRTRWWRFYDFMWGLHIMDLQTREDTHHPVLIVSALLSLGMVVLGGVLMFRRRRARPS